MAAAHVDLSRGATPCIYPPPKRARHSCYCVVIGPLLIGCVVGGLAACESDRPLAPTRPTASVVTASDSTPFYYYQGQKIYLNVDPSRLVVSGVHGVDPASAVTAIARAVLSASGVSLDSVEPIMQEPDHDLAYLPQATPAAVTAGFRAALAKNPQFRFVSPVYTTQVGGAQVVPLDRVVVKFRSGISDAQITALADSMGLAVERTPKPDSGFSAYWFTYPANPSTNTLAIAAALDQNALVSWADPDKISDRHLSLVPTDPYFSDQYYMKNTASLNGVPVDIDAEPAWDLTTGSSTIRVAVIGTGVQQAQPDVGPALVAGYDTFNNPPEDALHPCLSCFNPNENETGDAHGTAVAGILAGQQNNSQGVSGVAPHVQVVVARILRNELAASDANIANAINWSWNTEHADVINNSWGGGSSSNAVTNAIQSAAISGRAGKGTVVVCSAGNDAHNPGVPAPVIYPANLSASFTGVLAVGAVDRNGVLSWYSNTGPELTVVAPSSGDVLDVTTTDLIGSPGYNHGPGATLDYTSEFGGTSAAAPQVSGIAALILSREPGLLNSQVRDRIEMSADPWATSSPNTQFGFGKVNAYKALIDFQVLIDGPFLIRRSGLATWKVDIVRGIGGTYTYTWEYSQNGSYWTTVGTNATYSRNVQLGDPTFYLRVSVNSGLATMQDTRTINVAP